MEWPAPQMTELWAEAEAGRNLFWGSGGRDAAPDRQGEYQFVARDTTGKSPGYDRPTSIFVVKDHTIVERGTHLTLLASGGFYSELYDIQFRKDEPDVVFA
jgi:hypothetical protein